MRKSKFAALLASTAMIMSPAERQMGRLMRSPDDHAPTPAPAPAADAPAEDFSAFEKRAMSGEEGEKAPAAKEPETPAEGVDDDGEDGDDAGDPNVNDEGGDDKEDGEGEEGKEPKKGKISAKERIQQLNRQLRESEKARETDRKGFEARFERLEKGLPAASADDTKAPTAVAPDPTDLEKYPLGALDDAYIEDKLEFLAEQKAEAKLGSLLQREQQKDQQAESERVALELQARAETVASKGAELFADFDEIVVKPAMAGDFDLDQPTFEAVADAEHGPQILYNLATDPKEAARVAKLSPYNQLKYVLDENAKLAGTKPPEPRKIPGADAPPAPTVRGQGARKIVSADTTDFAAFEKLAKSQG